MAGSEEREAWLAQVDEDVIDPERQIIDPHFHFFTGRGHEFLAADFLAKMMDQGHNVSGAIHIEANADFFADGGAAGELRFVSGQAAVVRALQAGRPRIRDFVAGMVGYVDLRGAHIDEEIDALIEASGGLLRGIRNSAARDPDPDVRNGHTDPPAGLLADAGFRRGLSRLARRGLSYDAYVYFPQLPELVEVAQAVPELSIVCDHLGGLIGVGSYKGRHSEYFEHWKKNIAALARCSNVSIKLGGVAMSPAGFGWHKRDKPLSSAEYAAHYAPWFDHAIDQFTPERCMFESNFPVDRVALSYRSLWNAFKRLTKGYSEPEVSALFCETAKRVYRLP